MLDVFKNSTTSWLASHPMTHAAAASYYAVFSLPGLMIIMISIATFFVDEDVVRGHIHNYIGNFIGKSTAENVESIIDNARLSSSGLTTLIIGGGVLLFGSTGLFNQLKVSMNSVWGVKPKQEKLVLRLVVNRFVSLSVAIMIGFLLFMSMMLSAASEVFGNWMVTHFPALDFITASDFGISFLTISLLFTIIYKILPDVRIRITYALVAGVMCAGLFIIGEFFFSNAVKILSPQNVFGAAGSIILLMLWVTYGCMILQYGAEFIKALMRASHEDIRTKRFAQPIL